VPVGSPDFGLGFGAAAGAHIDQGEAAAGAPAEPNGSAGFRERGFDNQLLFGNTDFVHELAFGSEQIAPLVITCADQLGTDRDTASAADGHAIEAELNARLADPIEHEAILQITWEQPMKSNIGDDGALILDGSINAPDFDVCFEATPPGGNGPVTNMEVFDLQKFSLLSLQPGANIFQVPRVNNIQLAFSIGNVTAPLNQGQEYQDQYALQHTPSFGSPTLPSDRKSRNEVARNAHGSMVRCREPALSGIEGPALSCIEGPALSAAEGSSVGPCGLAYLVRLVSLVYLVRRMSHSSSSALGSVSPHPSLLTVHLSSVLGGLARKDTLEQFRGAR